MTHSDYWVIKTCSGYKLESGKGEYLKRFDSAIDCKSYCQSKGFPYKYINEKTSPEIKLQYLKFTGKIPACDVNYDF